MRIWNTIWSRCPDRWMRSATHSLHRDRTPGGLANPIPAGWLTSRASFKTSPKAQLWLPVREQLACLHGA
jgi:hypothetical protein